MGVGCIVCGVRDGGVLCSGAICSNVCGGLALCSRVEDTCMYDSIISLKGEIWAHKPSLILPPFIEMPVPSQEMVCAISIDVVSFSNSSSGFCSDSGLVFVFRFNIL